MKKISVMVLSALLLLSLAPVALAAEPLETKSAAAYLQTQGIMVGDGNGNMRLDDGLNRAELAVILTRMTADQEYLMANGAFYAAQCTFTDVPAWARTYVGYCAANQMMVGYGNNRFGAYDPVTPAAACTVMLRSLNCPETDWNYHTAVQKAVQMGLTTAEAMECAEITRGDMALLATTLILSTQAAVEFPMKSLRVSSNKGTKLSVGDISCLLVSEADCTAASSAPDVVGIAKVLGRWTATAQSPGSAVITITAPDGRSCSVTITVVTASPVSGTISGNDDKEQYGAIRQEIIRLVNQVRVEAGVPPLTINAALMNAAQDCSARCFTEHNPQYECETALAYGYPHGFGSNLAILSGGEAEDYAQRAVTCWRHSPGHFRAMVDENADCIGVGVTIVGERAFCYMFAGDCSAHNPYE